MSAKKHAWTEPGAIDQSADAVEARKGTAAANPVLSLAPTSQTPVYRDPSAAPARPAEGSDDHRSADHRSPAQIEAEIEQTRDRLAWTLDELTERLTPRALMRQTNAKARGVFVAADGRVRMDRAAIAAGSLASIVGGLVALRLLRRD
jgi:hypothetical protein